MIAHYNRHPIVREPVEVPELRAPLVSDCTLREREEAADESFGESGDGDAVAVAGELNASARGFGKVVDDKWVRRLRESVCARERQEG